MSDTVFDPLINHDRSQVLSNQYLFRSELLTKMDKLTGEALDLQGLINGLNQSSSLVGISDKLGDLSLIKAIVEANNLTATDIRQAVSACLIAIGKLEIQRTAAEFKNGTIAAGGTAQEIALALATRRYFFVLNPSNADLMLQFGSAASATKGILLKAKGGYFESPAHFVATGAASIFGATTGQSFTWMEG
jgi:hypothetical protein